MSMPTAPLGAPRPGSTAVKHGLFALAAALLLGPGGSLQAAPATPTPELPAETHQLQALLQDRRAEPSLRASAATTLGLSVGVDAIPTLLPLLQDRDEHVRASVARALGRLGGAQVQQALEERIPLEEDPLVREALQQGLTYVEP
jgi:HEAT repeat protein